MFALAAAKRQAFTAFLQDLVRIPSFSGQEKAVAGRLAAEMRAVGFHEVWTDHIGNVVGRIGPGTGPRLLYDGHLDVVGIGDPAAWTYDPFGADIVDGVLYGRGSADMKGGLASLVYGAGLLVDSGRQLAGDLYVVGVVQEEPTEGHAIRRFLEAEGWRPDWVLLAEPSNLRVMRGHRGRMELHVTVHGRSAHAAMPHQGENAISGAARAICALESLPAAFGEDPFLGQGALAVTQIESWAASRNAIPDRCTFVVDRRLTRGETPAAVVAQVQEVLARAGVRGTARLAEFQASSYTGHIFHGVEYYPAWVIPEDHPLTQALVRAVETATGARPAVGRWDFCTDGAYTMGQAGIPTVGLGPGDPTLAHQADEHIRLADCYAATQIYAQLAADVLGT